MSFTPSAADCRLIDRVQHESLRYFWDFAHPVSFMARDRARSAEDPGDDTGATGGTGMGIMAILAGVERGWLARDAAARRLLTLAEFLLAAERHHGALPHFVNAATGRTIAFSPQDNGGDLVETAFLVQGLLAARQYFDRDGDEALLRSAIDRLWLEVEWDWYTRGGGEALYWHWSPTAGWVLDHPIRGWNECLIVYLLAVASPSHGVDPALYHSGFASGPGFENGESYYGFELPLGPPYGGPLFFAHYSFLGLDPRGLCDRYADYFAQNLAHTRINHAHCTINPGGFAGYGPDCWGLTASDDETGYVAHAPDNDTGVITPSAALASFPYVPALAMAALRRFAAHAEGRLWGRWGLVDAFRPSTGWIAGTHLAIDQGPIVAMIENWRSALLWRLFMSCPEIAPALARLGFWYRTGDGM